MPHLLLANAVKGWGGGERFLVDAASGLSGRRWRVSLQAQPGSPLAAAASAAGLPVHEVRTRANGAPWTVAPLAVWLARHRVDVVLTNFDKDLRTTALAARLAPRRIRVVHSFECDEPLKRRWYLPRIYTALSDLFLFNSGCTRDTVLGSAPRLASVPHRILPKGVVVEEELVRRRPDDEVTLGFLGQLVARKELPLLLRALHSAPLRRPWQLRVAGQGPQGEHWRGLCRELGLEGNVHFDGFVDQPRRWLREIDVLVHPAMREGWGYAPVEALAQGCALIARRGGSVEEVLGAAPATAWFRDQTQLSALLAAWIDGDELPSGRQREAGVDFVKTRYSVRAMIDALEDCLRRTLTGP